MIFHIVTGKKWESIRNNEQYHPNSLDREGYIHCSFKDQVIKVANTFYKGQNDLLTLCINSKKVKADLKVEDLFNLNEAYPHIYGEVPMGAIEKVVKLTTNSNGEFLKPDLESFSSLVVKQKEWT